MQTFRTLLRIVDLKMFVVTALALASTWASERYAVVIDMPLELIGIAIVFPIVFSISQAFQRRESALIELAELKSNLVAIFLAHRDWPETDAIDHARRVQTITSQLYEDVQEVLRNRSRERLAQAYEGFSAISKSHERLRREGGVPPNEIARVNSYLKIAMMNFEKMRNIAVYRTPRSLRSFTQFFLISFPVLFGPYFAFLSSTSLRPVGYCVAVLYTVVLVGLDNIQEDLEDPYDGLGVDDIDFGESSATAAARPEVAALAAGVAQDASLRALSKRL